MSSKLPKYVPPSPFTPFLRRFTDERARDLAETIGLYNEVRNTYVGSLWANPQAIEHVNTLIAERVGEAVDLPNSSTLLNALDRCQQEILALETAIFAFPEIDLKTAVLSLKEHGPSCACAIILATTLTIRATTFWQALPTLQSCTTFTAPQAFSLPTMPGQAATKSIS